jgi:hypothetical protein
MTTLTAALVNTFRTTKRALTCTAVIAGVAISGSILTSEMRAQKKDALASVPSSLNADQVAKQFWRAILIQCGDSYYEDVLGHGIRRYKQPSFPPVVPGRVTNADRENGFLWHGWAYLTGGVYKTYTKDEGWSRWIDSGVEELPIDALGTQATMRKNVFLKMEMSNLNGKWSFSEFSSVQILLHNPTLRFDPRTMVVGFMGESDGLTPIKKASCAEIPGTPEYVTQHPANSR